jgi:hypothetical protein
LYLLPFHREEVQGLKIKQKMVFHKHKEKATSAQLSGLRKDRKYTNKISFMFKK